jgi:hypothetical protein
MVADSAGSIIFQWNLEVTKETKRKLTEIQRDILKYTEDHLQAQGAYSL